MEPLYKAKSQDGEWAIGYYTLLHVPQSSPDGFYLHHEEHPTIFNDKVDRVRGCWIDIDPKTLCQLTPMQDALGAPIWEHDTVRIYQLTRKSPNMPLHHVEGEVVMMSSCYAVMTDDGRTYPIVNLRQHYDLLVTGNVYDTPKPAPQTADAPTADGTGADCGAHEDGLRCDDEDRAYFSTTN